MRRTNYVTYVEIPRIGIGALCVAFVVVGVILCCFPGLPQQVRQRSKVLTKGITSMNMSAEQDL